MKEYVYLDPETYHRKEAKLIGRKSVALSIIFVIGILIAYFIPSIFIAKGRITLNRFYDALYNALLGLFLSIIMTIFIVYILHIRDV